MRDRILELLKQKGRPLPADQVLSEAVGVHSPNTATADKVLKAMLRDDPSFRNQGGLWSLSGAPATGVNLPLNRAAILFIEQARDSRNLLHVRGVMMIPENGFTASFGLIGDRPRFSVLRRIHGAGKGRVLVC